MLDDPNYGSGYPAGQVYYVLVHTVINSIRFDFIFKAQYAGIDSTVPKTEVAILGKLLPDPEDPFDQNSDPFLKENNDYFFF